MSTAARPAASPSDLPSQSTNLALVRDAFRRMVEEGVEAGVESLLVAARDDCEWRPYTADDRVLRGPEQVRAYYREALASGIQMRLKTSGFQEHGDAVIVDGTMRVARPTGGFSESQISWTLRFRDGLLTEAGWNPHRGG